MSRQRASRPSAEPGRASSLRPGWGTVAAQSLAGHPMRVLICRDDRLFPLHFLRRVARERVGITPDEIDGGHTPALSRPHELADRLEVHAAEQGLPDDH